MKGTAFSENVIKCIVDVNHVVQIYIYIYIYYANIIPVKPMISLADVLCKKTKTKLKYLEVDETKKYRSEQVICFTFYFGWNISTNRYISL